MPLHKPVESACLYDNTMLFNHGNVFLYDHSDRCILYTCIYKHYEVLSLVRFALWPRRYQDEIKYKFCRTLFKVILMNNYGVIS